MSYLYNTCYYFHTVTFLSFHFKNVSNVTLVVFEPSAALCNVGRQQILGLLNTVSVTATTGH